MESILAAARRAVAARGPGKLTLSAVAAAAEVSRPTLYRWFPTKAALFAALKEYEERQFDTGLQATVEAHRTPARQLDAALRYLVTYLDGSMGPDPIGADPAFALQSFNRSLPSQIKALARLLRDALDEVPAVAAGEVSREQAAEMFLRLTYSHYLVPHADSETILATVRGFAGLPRRSLRRVAANRRTGRG